MRKKCFILFLGDQSNNHTSALNKVISGYWSSFVDGFKFIHHEGNSNFYEDVESELDKLKERNIEPILMKGFNIHTEDYIRAIIKYYKRDHKDKKFLLTHCAVFDDFILSDAALLTNYTNENILTLINNALLLADNLIHTNKWNPTGRDRTKIALLNAGGSSNISTATQEWQDIYNTLNTYTKLNKNNYESNFKVEMDQLDSCLDSKIRASKSGKGLYESELPFLIIPSSINEGNSIWKSLTVIGGKSLAGIVTGIPMSIGLTSRTDGMETIEKTLDLLLYLLYYNKGNTNEII